MLTTYDLKLYREVNKLSYRDMCKVMGVAATTVRLCELKPLNMPAWAYLRFVDLLENDENFQAMKNKKLICEK